MNDLDLDEDEPETGTGGRVGIALIVAAIAAVIVWWLWPDHGRGEREQAHRVLIVGGTPSDLGAAIAEAGFEAKQQTWSDAETEVTALEQRFDLDALIGYADEHGYGFVALMFGDDYPWPEVSVLGEAPPDSAIAAVISVGELRLDETSRVRFGGPPPGLDYAPGIARAEGLRIALYDHPDLVRLWDAPSPDQQAQQVHLGKLADARTLLERMTGRYELAVRAWPSLPSDAVGGPWQEVRGLPIAGGLLVEVTPTRPIVDERRQLERRREQAKVVFVPDAALTGRAVIEPLAVGAAVELPVPGWAKVSANRKWLIGKTFGGDQRRYEATSTGVRMGAVVDDDGYALAISDSGQVAVLDDGHIYTDLGMVGFHDARVHAAAWDGDRLGIALEITTLAETEIWERYLLLVRPSEADAGPPATLVLDPDSLLAPGAAAPDTAWVSELFPTTAGLYVIVEHRTDERSDVRSLVRLKILDALPTAGWDDAQALLTGELLAAHVGSAEPFAPVTLGMLPYTEELDVAPDGSWIAWRAVGSRRTVRAAPIVGDAIGPDVEIDDGPAGHSLPGPIGPLFRADSRTLVFADAAATGLSEKSDDYFTVDPWTAEYLRVVTLPKPE